MKKVIALTLACVMLITSSPAVAADNTSAKPTVEEILDSYHERAIAAQSQPDAAASTYSRRSAEKTLEQETVDELNAAGYEAYNVNGDNYENMQDVLNTDLTSLGIAEDGSYIVVISGEDEETGNGASPRVIDLPHIGGEDPGLGTGFTFTYNGVAYNMRYVTITSNDDESLYESTFYVWSEIATVEDYISDFLPALLCISADYIGKKVPLGTIATIISPFFTDTNIQYLDPDDLIIHAATGWSQKFIQIWDSDASCWRSANSSAYAYSSAYFAGHTRDSVTGMPVSFVGDEYTMNTYSPNYNNSEQQKEDAVEAYLLGSVNYDTTGNISFYAVGTDKSIVFTGDGSPLFVHQSVTSTYG